MRGLSELPDRWDKALGMLTIAPGSVLIQTLVQRQLFTFVPHFHDQIGGMLHAASPLAGTDPAELKAAASAAGLRYVSDRSPGIRRIRTANGFDYRQPDGQKVSDEETLARIRKLAIPPAYEDVWICPRPNGHLQAVGRDVRGRKQYRYHPRWRQVRDEAKYGKLLVFGNVLPKIRARLIATDVHGQRRHRPDGRVDVWLGGRIDIAWTCSCRRARCASAGFRSA